MVFMMERDGKGLLFTSSLITRISRYHQIYLNHALKPLGINASQYLYIVVLCKEGAIRQDRLPARIGIDKSNVTRMLIQLEKEGFLRRVVSDEDKRTYDIYPTEKAIALNEPVMKILEEWDRDVMKMDEEAKSQFRKLLELILDRSENAGKSYLNE